MRVRTCAWFSVCIAARQTDPSDPAVQEASSKTATRPDMLKAEDQGGIAHPNSEPGGNGSSKATSTSGDSSATVQSSAASGSKIIKLF